LKLKSVFGWSPSLIVCCVAESSLLKLNIVETQV